MEGYDLNKDFETDSYNKFPNHSVYGLNDEGMRKHRMNRRLRVNLLYQTRKDVEERMKNYHYITVPKEDNKRIEINEDNSSNGYNPYNTVNMPNKSVIQKDYFNENNTSKYFSKETEDLKKINAIKRFAASLKRKEKPKEFNSTVNYRESSEEKGSGHYLIPDKYLLKPKNQNDIIRKSLLKTLYCKSPSHNKNIKTMNLANIIDNENKNIKNTVLNTFLNHCKNKTNLPKIKIGTRQIISQTKESEGRFGVPNNHLSYFMGEKYNPSNFEIQRKNWTQRNVFGSLFTN